MKEHQAGGKAWQICNSFSWHRFKTSDLKGRESGCNLCCERATGLREEVFAKLRHKGDTHTVTLLTRLSYIGRGGLCQRSLWRSTCMCSLCVCMCPQLRQTQHTKKIIPTQIRDSTNTQHHSTGWQGKDRMRRDILYSAPSSPTQDITHWRMTLLVGKISGEP